MTTTKPFVFSRVCDYGEALTLRRPATQLVPKPRAAAPASVPPLLQRPPSAPDREPQRQSASSTSSIAEDVFALDEAEAPAEPAAVPSVSQSSRDFTRRQLEKLVKDPQVLAGVERAMAISSPVATPASGRPVPPAAPAQPKAAATNDPHAIFAKIAQSMQFATTYELPAVEIEQVFDAFESNT